MKPGNLPNLRSRAVRCQVQRFFVKMRTNAQLRIRLGCAAFFFQAVLLESRKFRKELHNDQPNFYL